MKTNSFNAGLKITTPVAVPDMFPCVGQRITGNIPEVTEHWMGPCQWHDDPIATVDGRLVTVNGNFRAELPEGSTVETVTVAR